jgi:hypothetical protein
MVVLEKYFILVHGYVVEVFYTSAWLCWRSIVKIVHGGIGEVFYTCAWLCWRSIMY